MPATLAKQTDVDFERSASAEEQFWRLQKQYDAALARQPNGAARVALRRLKRVRDQADISFPDGESQPREAGDVDSAAEADDTERACAKLRLKIAALAAAGESGKSDDGGEAKELTAKADAFRKTLKALEAEAERAADAVAKAEAAVQDVANRGRDLRTEIEREIETVEAKLGHDTRAH
jgi:hypothetical protein